jgi:hypothetical protein
MFEYEIETGKVEGLKPRQDMKLRLKICRAKYSRLVNVEPSWIFTNTG